MGVTDYAAAWHDTWQHPRRYAEDFQQFLVPLQAMNIEHQRSGGIAGIGDMQAAQLADQPAVNGAEGKLAAFGTFARAGYMVEQPFDLGAGKIGVQHESSLALKQVGMAGFTQCVANIGGASILPDDGITDCLASGAVPHDGCFALVGDADRSDVCSADCALLHYLACDGELGLPDIFRVMLDPAWMRKDLPEFLLCAASDMACPIEQNGTGAGCPLVQRKDVVAHACLVIVIFVVIVMGNAMQYKDAQASLAHQRAAIAGSLNAERMPALPGCACCSLL